MEEEFEEEEVWAAAGKKKADSPKIRKKKEGSTSSSSQSARREVPRSNFVGEQSRRSAPVRIPNWSRKNCGEEEDDEDDDNLPPHEWLARKMARNQISSSSVCEGAGRTLKGRDQRKVREAVLARTGFLE